VVMPCHSCPGWSLKYAGRAVKIARGKSGKVVFALTPCEEKVEVEIVDNPNNLNLSIQPRRKPYGEILVEIDVPEKTPYKPVWLVTLEFKSSSKSEKGYIAVLPVDENSRRKTIREGKSDDKAFAVGAPGFLYADRYYLSYRWRDGDKVRGGRLELAASHDGLEYEAIKTFRKEDYNYLSFEQSCFAKNNPEGLVFLYSADMNRRWSIYMVEAKRVDEITLPGKPVIRNGKDPACLYDKDLQSYIVVYSNSRNPGHDLTVVLTRDFEDITVKCGSMFYNQPVIERNKWARTHIHAGSLFKTDGYYVLFYDALPSRPSCFGSGWLGLAISRNLVDWIDLTPDQPLWRGAGIDNTFRYVDAYFDDNSYILYAEEETTVNGRKDLVAYFSL